MRASVVSELEHRAIVDAIAARDPVAARHHATQHLIRGERRLVEGGIISGRQSRRTAMAARAVTSPATPLTRK